MHTDKILRTSFSGNEIAEMYPPTTCSERFVDLWRTSNRFLAQLYQSRLATVAAISGECLTSGFCFALCCDERVASENVRLGFTEVRLGLPVPPQWCKLLSTVIGFRKAEMHSQMGTILDSNQALSTELVQQVNRFGCRGFVSDQYILAMLSI